MKTVPLEPLQLKTARGQKFALIVMYVCSQVYHCMYVCNTNITTFSQRKEQRVPKY